MFKHFDTNFTDFNGSDISTNISDVTETSKQRKLIKDFDFLFVDIF